MATTVTEVSRVQLDHPDLGHDGGALLHTRVRNAWTKLGDALASRFFVNDALADAANVDFIHNFKVAFSDLTYVLYTRNTGTGELTRVESGGTPDLEDFTIEATPGFLTTRIRVTNNSGGAEDIALVVFHRGPSQVDYVDEYFAPSGVNGAGPYAVTEPFGTNSKIDCWINGVLQKETVDFDRDVANGEIDILNNFPSGELRVRVWR